MEYPTLSEYQVTVLTTIANSTSDTFLAPDPSLMEEDEKDNIEKITKNLAELNKLAEMGMISCVTDKVPMNDELKGKMHAFKVNAQAKAMFQDSEGRLVN